MIEDEIDLFEDYDNLPNNVLAITDKIQDDWTYEQCAETIEELNEIGYTADYGLDAQLHSLQKMYRDYDELSEAEKMLKTLIFAVDSSTGKPLDKVYLKLKLREAKEVAKKLKIRLDI